MIVDDVLLRFDDDGGIGKNSNKLPDIFSTAGVSIVKRLQKNQEKIVEFMTGGMLPSQS